jgi:hypothetical protein
MPPEYRRATRRKRARGGSGLDRFAEPADAPAVLRPNKSDRQLHIEPRRQHGQHDLQLIEQPPRESVKL